MVRNYIFIDNTKYRVMFMSSKANNSVFLIDSRMKECVNERIQEYGNDSRVHAFNPLSIVLNKN